MNVNAQHLNCSTSQSKRSAYCRWKQKGLEERIDHRSHAERGLEEQPTIHEGVAARAMEAKGFISDRCELNRQIKADNALLRTLRESVQRLSTAFENSVAGIATALESLLEKIVVAHYGVYHAEKRMKKLHSDIDRLIRIKQEYDDVQKALRQKISERKRLQAEKKSLIPLHIKQHIELSKSITTLTE